jgi:general secretion pathway protein A
MYKEHFGLNETPFSIAPDPHYLYMSDQHREALAHLVYGISSDGGFVLLTGEVGTGKTTVCRCLLEQLPGDADVAFILNPALSVEELLGTVCDELGIDYPEDNRSVKTFVDRINAYLLDAHARGRKTVVIIEEAQNLRADVLEQLRLLTNLETNQRKLLQIIMIGQPELREMVSRPELRQLAQRITARYHMGPLSKKDVAGYLNHRLSVAGVQKSLFTSSALNELYRRSRGIPRLINIICDRALLGAYVQGQDNVDKRTLSKAAREVVGDEKIPRRVLKWVLAALTLVISVTALAATFYSQRIHFFPENKMQHTGLLMHLNGSQENDKLTWPSDKSLESSKEAAYRAVFSKWKIPYPSEPSDPCKQAQTWGLDCIDTKGNFSSALRLNKPLVVRLADNGGREFYAGLTSIQAQGATLVIGDKVRRVSVDDISRSWPGSYTLLWRTPRKFLASLGPGSKGREVRLLEKELSLISGNTARSRSSAAFDNILAAQVKQFQFSEGLETDGIVGPQTFMHLNIALRRMEPTLSGKGPGN